MSKLRDLFTRKRPFARTSKITPATFGHIDRTPAENHPWWLLLAAVLVIGLPYVPLGNYLLYPFFILTTWFHEMGHGLTAMLLGMNFDSLVIEASGSGYALYYADPDSWDISFALVAAGGPLGPAIAGALMILASAKAQWRRASLIALGTIMLLSTAIWVRSLVGWAVLIPTAAMIFYIAECASNTVSRFTLQFLGVHAAISMFGQWGYLFSSGAVIAGSHKVSDTGAMAQYLPLPYYVWAGVLVAIGALIIGASLLRVLRRKD